MRESHTQCVLYHKSCTLHRDCTKLVKLLSLFLSLFAVAASVFANSNIRLLQKLLSRGDSSISVSSMSTNGNSVLNKSTRNVAPGRHIIQAESIVIHKTLGSGEFGTVQQGVWTSDDNERVCVIN